MSVRMGVNELADRWKRVAKALPGEDRVRAERIVAMAKRHSSELFYGLDDPLEAAAFSVLIEILKEQDLARAEGGAREPGQPGRTVAGGSGRPGQTGTGKGGCPATGRAGEGTAGAESPGETGPEDRGVDP